ncbi:diacylglycerol/lipid kinase family protein [Leifsonia sp. 21MFCrub1.1]|uniref:diacylglycerol/lipid kinase family protein n=1 Tax=Leifsonia sp. 21MFCrub1.1 TaxID=1798223 RepID=UPI000892899E|nr:diacylglycerol kinase family protein [Leifsonia sp. 21MFCrub1.1]SEA33226.1 Diacylglycerol kinase family enzyme [Leifsonia sp. 21MFCrub1.1]
MCVNGRDGEQRRVAAVVYNPVRVDVPRVRAAVEAAATLHRYDLLWLETTPEEPGQAQVGEALAQGASLVLAAGGDGTVRAVAEALRGRDATLGIIPGGTGNLLARNLGIPFASVEASCAVAFDGESRRMDMGVATAHRPDGSTTEHAFLVMAGVGIDAAMIANARPELKRRFGWLAYVDAAFRSLPTASKVPVRYRLDNGPERSAHVSTILVANCGALPGNMELIPDGELDDGLLDVAVVQPATVFGWLAIWRKVTWENRVLRRSSVGRRIIRFTDRAIRTRLSYLRGASVELAVDAPEPFELDGDAFGDVLRLELRVDELALRVKAPAATAGVTAPGRRPPHRRPAPGARRARSETPAPPV